MTTLTAKQKSSIRRVFETIKENTVVGISLGELAEKARLSSTATKTALSYIDGITVENGLYFYQAETSLQNTSQVNETAPVINDDNELEDTTVTIQAPVQSIIEEAQSVEVEKLTMPKKPRNKPFTPNPIMGYQVQKGKAKIFLDRRATSKTLTLSLDDLKELVNAVEKSERVGE